MKTWIVRETGEFRRANNGEWIKDGAAFRLFDAARHTQGEYDILSVTEIPGREETAKKIAFILYCYSEDEDTSYVETGRKIYDRIFGEEKKPDSMEENTPCEGRWG